MKARENGLMSNHDHLLVETLEATLSAGMRAVNGIYTQSYNARHSRVGHLFPPINAALRPGR